MRFSLFLFAAHYLGVRCKSSANGNSASRPRDDKYQANDLLGGTFKQFRLDNEVNPRLLVNREDFQVVSVSCFVTRVVDSHRLVLMLLADSAGQESTRPGMMLQCSIYIPEVSSLIDEDERLPLLVFCHGNAGSRRVSTDVVKLMTKAGFAVLAFDFCVSTHNRILFTRAS